MDTAISVDGLTKRFGALTAVDGARFEVPAGVVYGFLGPNGSGKTTTLAMLTGLLAPDAGTARILGHDVRADLPGALRVTGALIEEPAFYAALTGRQNLQLLSQVMGLAQPADAADEALARVGLSDAAGQRYRGYSLGMRRRLGIAAAILGDKPVLLLDEPTNGLDPAGQLAMRAFLRDLAARGRTVLVSSHLLHEVQETCSHVAIIHKGRILAQGPLRDVVGDADALVLRVDDVAKARATLARIEGVRGVRELEGARLRVDAPVALAARVNRALVEAGVGVSELLHQQPALEERFLEMTQEARA